MLQIIKILIILPLLSYSLFAAKIETFYGIADVEETVLLELIESPPFQRLKHIHQYGVSYYAKTYCADFTRYDHSLGVFFLLRAQECSLEEQIAGLLHDVSHTIFSHVGDWIFNQQNQETDYQTLTHIDYIECTGLGSILRKHGYSVENILPKEELFPALEQSLPTLCADRLDYNLQGAFHQGLMTYEEVLQLSHEIKFIDGEWISNDHELLKKLVRSSLFLSEYCWGSRTEHLLSIWLAEAILRGVDLQIISMEDIRFGVDEDIWKNLILSKDPLIVQKIHMLLNPSNYFSFVSKAEADFCFTGKFRGIDPLVIFNGKRVRLTTTDLILKEEFERVKNTITEGWAIKWLAH